MHCSRHWGIESCILLCLDYQYARKIRKQINFHWNNYEDNEERRKHVLQSPSLCLFTTILIHRDDDISVSKSISLQLLTCFCPINGLLSGMFSSVQSVMSDSLWCHRLQHVRPLSITDSQSLLKLMSTEWVMPSSHLILCHPLLLLPSNFPNITISSNESALCFRWPKYWSFSFNISPSNECSGLISFRMDWLDLLAVQGTLNSLLQHHSSKASILCGSDFLIV